MPWGAVAGAVVSYGLNSMGGSSGQAASAADPFAAQRGQYQNQLSSLMNNPQSAIQNPAYQAEYAQGLSAANAGSAASGMLNSGNRLLALQNYGQNAEASAYQQQFNNLSVLSGATQGSPGTAGNIMQNQNTQNQQAIGTLSGAIGNAAKTGVNSWGTSAGGNYSGVSASTPYSDISPSTGNVGFTGVGNTSSPYYTSTGSDPSFSTSSWFSS